MYFGKQGCRLKELEATDSMPGGNSTLCYAHLKSTCSGIVTTEAEAINSA